MQTGMKGLRIVCSLSKEVTDALLDMKYKKKKL